MGSFALNSIYEQIGDAFTIEANEVTSYGFKDLSELGLSLSTSFPCTYWENNEGDSYLGINPLSDSMAATFEKEAANTYLKKAKGTAFITRKFEEASCKLLFFQMLFKKKNDGIFLITIKAKDLVDLSHLLGSLDSFYEEKSNRISPLLVKKRENPSFETWKSRIEVALEALNSFENPITKVVLKRNIEFNISGIGPSAFQLFCALKEKNNQGYKVFIPTSSQDEAFMSFSPESLFKKEKEKTFINLEAIAGTRPRGESEEEDANLEEELLNDPKELREHQAVIEEIVACTSNFGGLKLGSLSVLKLKKVQHLRTPITLAARKSFKMKSITALADALHPTPAVCGTPTELSKDFIQHHEGERGYYAGLFGVINANSFEASVLIRSLTYNKKTAELTAHGGAGIVSGSCAENEWNETANKIDSFLGEFLPNQNTSHEVENSEGTPSFDSKKQSHAQSLGEHYER